MVPPSTATFLFFSQMRMISKQMRWQGDRFGFHLREFIVIASPPISF